MQTINRLFKQTLTVFLFFTAPFGYHAVIAESVDAANPGAHSAHNSLDWPGLYVGFMPCADCNGIKTTLALNKNNSYILITKYVGKSEREFVEKGKFAWSETGNTIILTPRKGSEVHYYLLGENTLTQLDQNGKRITGELAGRYVLRRKDVTEPPSSHSAH